MTDEGLCRVGWSTAHATLDLGEWTDRVIRQGKQALGNIVCVDG